MNPRNPDFRAALDLGRPYHRALGVVLGLSSVAAAADVALPYLLKPLVDDALLGRDLPALERIVAWMVGLSALSFAITGWSGSRYARVSADILYDLRSLLFTHLHGLSPRFFSETPPRDVASRLNDDLAEVRRVAADAFLGWPRRAATLAGSVVAVAWLDPDLLPLLLVASAPAVWATLRFGSRLDEVALGLRERGDALSAFLVESLEGMRTIVGGNAQRAELERVRTRDRAFASALLTARRTRHLARSLPVLLLWIGIAGVFLYGSAAVLAGSVTLGTLLAILAYQARILAPVRGLMGLRRDVSSVQVAFGRIRALLRAEPEVAEPLAPVPIPKARGELTLDGVRFGQRLLGDAEAGVDLVIPAGQVVAMVGPSPSGEARIGDLFNRMVDPDEGRLLLDGTDLRELALEDVRRHVHVVESEPFLFDASIRRNVLFGRSDADDFAVWDALGAAGLDRAVQSMPDGLCTIVGAGGRSLTRAQRLRLALARAFLANPAVLVLDEVTAALDPAADPSVVERYVALMKNRTTVVVTHRLDIARHAQRVVVLKGGRIIEDGAPQVLESKGVSFRDLFVDVLAG